MTAPDMNRHDSAAIIVFNRIQILQIQVIIGIEIAGATISDVYA
jgi:hypothetical protein